VKFAHRGIGAFSGKAAGSYMPGLAIHDEIPPEATGNGLDMQERLCLYLMSSKLEIFSAFFKQVTQEGLIWAIHLHT
jgi:hypothetical protein